MNYIDQIAKRIAPLCGMLFEAPPLGVVDDDGREIVLDTTSLLRHYAVLCLVKGPGTTNEDVHDAWSAWTAATQPEHVSLVPFDDLAPEIQALDEIYRDAIIAVATERLQEAGVADVDWNARYPVGTAVRIWPDGRGNARTIDAVTTSVARVTPRGDPVVDVDGDPPRCVCLVSVEPLEMLPDADPTAPTPDQPITAADWNSNWPVGTPVRYWPGGRKGASVESKTWSSAWCRDNSTHVVGVEGYAGAVALTHVEPVCGWPEDSDAS